VLYVSLYSFGRFFVETLRIDPAFIIGTSFRGNLLVSGVLAVGFALILILRQHRTPRARPDPD
jgi:phosphatidylglycerol---prolipoprotein diacylglyceryl transferase